VADSLGLESFTISRLIPISLLQATSGHITVEGRGLLLAGGSPTLPALNVIGTNGGQSVKAELFCNTTPSNCGTAHTSGLVPLDVNGDFKIDDTLSPLLPSTGTKPVLLITNSPAGIAKD
jgi:hypothetical protein